jgi:hypothetical protein
MLLPQVALVPFRGRVAVAAGLVTRRQLAGPRWRRLFPDVYAAAGLPLDHATWCRAAVLAAGPRGVLSGRSAAQVWGADLLTPDTIVEVTVPHQVRLAQRPGLTMIRSHLRRPDVARIAGLPVTSAVRTAFDLGRRPPLVDAVVALDALLHTRALSLDQVVRYADDHPAWPGAALLRQALALADAGAESPMETRTRLVLILGELPRPVTQFEVRDASGRLIGRLDLAYPDDLVGIEYEGDHHRAKAQFQRDLRRLNALQAMGWQVLRFGPSDIYHNPDAVLAQVRAALRG